MIRQHFVLDAENKKLQKSNVEESVLIEKEIDSLKRDLRELELNMDDLRQ